MYIVGTGTRQGMNHQNYFKIQDLFAKKHRDNKCTLKIE